MNKTLADIVNVEIDKYNLLVDFRACKISNINDIVTMQI